MVDDKERKRELITITHAIWSVLEARVEGEFHRLALGTGRNDLLEESTYLKAAYCFSTSLWIHIERAAVWDLGKELPRAFFLDRYHNWVISSRPSYHEMLVAKEYVSIHYPKISEFLKNNS